MGSPATVLVDGQLHALPLGQLDQAFAFVQIEHERFLAQHVLAGLQGGLNDRCLARSGWVAISTT